MKRAIISLLFLLITCTPQQAEDTPENNKQSWIYHTGLIIEFPMSWQVISLIPFTEGFYFQDEYGTFMLTRDGRDHETMERVYIGVDESFVELEVEGDTRLFRQETTYEIDGYPELFEGITDVIEYVAFLPNETVLSFVFPLIPEFDAREALFYDVLFNASTFDTELNVIGLAGGFAVMLYPDDWEITHWNDAGSPIFSNNNDRFVITVRDEEFYRRAIARNEETERDISTQEVIDYALDTSYFFMRTEGEITANSRYGQVLYRLENYFLLYLDNGLMIEIGIDLNEGSTEEDERIAMLMIDSILLNNRSDYRDTIDLIVPVGMTE